MKKSTIEKVKAVIASADATTRNRKLIAGPLSDWLVAFAGISHKTFNEASDDEEIVVEMKPLAIAIALSSEAFSAADLAVLKIAGLIEEEEEEEEETEE